MNFDENAINTVHQQSGFDPLYIEKVLRLLGILELFFSNLVLKDKYVIKGGTALNLFHFKLPRLSVDIDLNYLGLDREIMLTDRQEHEQILSGLLADNGYNLKRIPSEHAGGKWRLGYRSYSGITQNIELDLNYMHRIALMPVEKRSSFPLGVFKADNIPVLNIHELAAGKLCALIARCKPRDLFDAYHLLNCAELDLQTLRRCFVVYAAFNKVDFSEISCLGELKFDTQQFRQELMETLAHSTTADTPQQYLEKLLNGCQEKLNAILPFTESELAFLTAVNKHGEIKPELLNNSPTWCEFVSKHPMLQWKVFNVRKHYGL
ncbi:MAG: nucleotidyl transferase AbiEii/AbiGii toxin family protein [Lentisphaeria bacterium]|nr:nucleotidyl transferase AbiEii/AbiGii toxin family protein [Lentisphaeria bacterium]